MGTTKFSLGPLKAHDEDDEGKGLPRGWFPLEVVFHQSPTIV